MEHVCCQPGGLVIYAVCLVTTINHVLFIESQNKPGKVRIFVTFPEFGPLIACEPHSLIWEEHYVSFASESMFHWPTHSIVGRGVCFKWSVFAITRRLGSTNCTKGERPPHSHSTEKREGGRV